MENYDTWKVHELKELLLQYNINIQDIKGSGKNNNNVLKADIIKTIQKSPEEKLNIGNYNFLPNEMIKEIAYHLDLDDILSLCTVEKRSNIVCDKELWEIVYWKYYGDHALIHDFKHTVLTIRGLEHFISVLKIKTTLEKLFNQHGLFLNRRKLKFIPKEIGYLTNLNTLSLEVNSLKLLPMEIGQLINLTELDISYNQLTLLPQEIGQLINLKVLRLNNNKLKSLPKEIGNLIQLKSLFLYKNKLQSLPIEIGNLSDLFYLYLNFNQLKSLPIELGNLINLKQLELENNLLTSVPKSLGNLTKLRDLNLRHNKLTSLPVELDALNLNKGRGLTTDIHIDYLSDKLRKSINLYTANK